MPNPGVPFVPIPGGPTAAVRVGEPPPRYQGVIATCAAFSPDNKFVLVGFGGGSSGGYQKRTALADSLILWDVASGKEIRTFKGHYGGVRFLSFSSDGIHAVSGGGDGFVRVWHVPSGAERRNFKVFDGGFRGVVSPDGKYLLANLKSLELWEVAEGKRSNMVALPKANVSSMVFLPNRESAFFSSNAGYLWDVKKLSVIEEFKYGNVRPLAFSQDDKYLVLGKTERWKTHLTLWDIPKRKAICTLGDESLEPLELVFTSDGKIICRTLDGQLVCWNSEGKQLWATKSVELQHSGYVFSPDGKRGLSIQGGLKVLGEIRPQRIAEFESKFALRIWNLENGLEVRSLAPPKLPEASPNLGVREGPIMPSPAPQIPK